MLMLRGGDLSMLGVDQGENLHEVATSRILDQNRSDDDVSMKDCLKM